MSSAMGRRKFLQQALAAGTATAALGSLPQLHAADAPRKRPGPNDRLNLGIIGVAARGNSNLNGVLSENIVALCDIDSQRLGPVAEKFPAAKTYSDFRKLLEQNDLDAVVVSTPDHTHAVAAVAALKRGLDVYCEKPLAHSVYEVRQMREWAARQNAVTQMGNQVHASDNFREVVELVQAGVLGAVTQVHVFNVGNVKPGVRVKQATPPAHVDYDLWTGPAPMRPFHESHFHFNWRYWWDYGNGALGDFGCHYMDLPFWALDLGAPTSVAARGEITYEGDNQVPDNMQVDYQFAARGDNPPVKFTWWHGKWRPEGAEEYGPRNAVLFEGQRGRLLADYRTHKVFLEPGLDYSTPEPTIPRSIGHHAEWIAACKSRGPTTSNFNYAGNLSEAVLLGNVAYRVGKPIQWDPVALKAPNCPEADQYIQREYRQGWSL